MTGESVNGFAAEHGVPIRERENLGLFLHHLCEELADQRCEIDSAKDRDFAYFDIKLPCDSDDIDICVHGRHVLVRMGRLE
jgi:hypothetical protein